LQDELLAGFLRAAIATIEARTGKILIEREFGWSLTAWRDAQRQPLPLAPVSALIRMVVVDRNGDEVLIDPARVQLVPDTQRPSLVPVSGILPTIPTDSILRIEMLAGYGPEWSDLPADLQHAVLMLAAHFHENRYEMETASLPFGVAALIERYRTVRIMMGGLA
jgi:uncharacterized phiE125 gp8 family phage protein